VILVAGGTGRLGTLVVRGLTDRGLPVRILTRDPARAQHLAGALVEVVEGDVRDRAAVASATSGATVVVSAVHGFIGPRGVSPATIDRDGNVNLMDAAKASGADFVLMSVLGAAADSPLELFRMKHAAERYLQASGVDATIVRAAAFLETWTDLLRQTARRSGRPVVFGNGDNPINFVSVLDVAAVVERAVTDPSTRARTLEIGGPHTLTLNRIALAVQAADGRTSPPRHVPPILLRVAAQTVGRINPMVGRQVRTALAMDTTDLSATPTTIRQAFPEIPSTTLEMCLEPGVPDIALAGETA
jgi:NADH dehydrogenase